jgi:type I restriction enzyme M protein
VKTSILFLNKNFAKKTDKFLFVKVNNDGFGLGAQRREIKEDDLPLALEIINKYKQCVIDSKEFEFNLNETKLAHLVKKEKIAESGDYNLSGDRYKKSVVYSNKWDMVELGEVCKDRGEYGSGAKKIIYDGNVRYVRITDIDDEGNLKATDIVSPSIIEEKYFLQKGDLLFARSGSVGRCYLHKLETGKYQFAGYLIRFKTDRNKILPDFIFYLTKSEHYWNWIKNQSKTGTLTNINAKQFSSFKILLPPLEIQEQIVAELDSYQKIIDGARQVVENYKPIFKIDPEWEMIELGDVCEFNPKKSEVRNFADDLEVSFIPMADLNEHKMLFSTKQTKNKAEVYQGYTYFKENDVLLARVTPCFENGKSGIARNLKNGIGFGSSEYFVYRPKKNILPEWIYYFISSLNFVESGKNHMTGTGGLQRLTKEYATSLTFSN